MLTMTQTQFGEYLPNCRLAAMGVDGQGKRTTGPGKCGPDHLVTLQAEAASGKLCWYRYDPGDGSNVISFWDPFCDRFKSDIDELMVEAFPSQSAWRPWYKNWKIWAAVVGVAAAAGAGAYAWRARA